MQSLRKITSRRIIKMKKLLRFTAIEYGVIAALAVLVIIYVVLLLEPV